MEKLDLRNVTRNSGSCFIELPLRDNPEFGLYFRASDPAAADRALELARDVLENLATMDNEVQQRCAAECAQTKLHRRNFESELAFGTLALEGVTLRYYGTGVNTEWDETFDRVNGRWIRDDARE